MHSPSNLWLPLVPVGVESSQPLQFVLLVKDQEQCRGTRLFQLENPCVMHLQKASASRAPLLHPPRGRTTRRPFLRL